MTTKINSQNGISHVHKADRAVERLSVLPLALHAATVDRFLIDHRIGTNNKAVKVELELDREQVAWLRDRLTDVLNETDPAYIAHMERAAAAGEPALPATDAEWKARLVEGGVA